MARELPKVYEPQQVENRIYEIAIDRNVRYEKYMDGIEYKFYEDENYEYYYPSQKTEVVKVFFKNGEFITAEQALKEGKITIELLDNYEVDYIKKSK